MKRFFALAAVAMLLAGSANAQAVKLGLKGGLNVTDMKLSGDVFDASNRAGWFIGPTIKINLPLTGLGIDAAALYDYRSADVKYDTSNAEEKTIKQQSLNIPINLRYGVGLGSTASVFLLAGPQFGFNVGTKNFKWNDTSNYALKKSNFSVNVGLGLSLLKHLELAANYNIACGKTADVTPLEAVHDVANTAVSKSKSRNNSWQISLAYYF